MTTPRRLRWIADGATAAVAAGALTYALRGYEHATIQMLLALPPLVAARLLPGPGAIEAGFAALLAAYSWGIPLGLLEAVPWADGAAHALLPFLAVLLTAPVLGRPSRACLVVAALAVLWEVAERGSDMAFGTSLSPSARDTVADLVADTVGILGAYALLRSHWPAPGAAAQGNSPSN